MQEFCGVRKILWGEVVLIKTAIMVATLTWLPIQNHLTLFLRMGPATTFIAIVSATST